MGRSPIGCRGHRNEQVLPIDAAAKNTRQPHRRRFSDDLPSLRNGQDGAYASRRVSNRLHVRQLRRPVATEAGRLLRVLLLRLGSLPAGSDGLTDATRRRSSLGTFPTSAQSRMGGRRVPIRGELGSVNLRESWFSVGTDNFEENRDRDPPGAE
jgi:hypothetical protein